MTRVAISSKESTNLCPVKESAIYTHTLESTVNEIYNSVYVQSTTHSGKLHIFLLQEILKILFRLLLTLEHSV